MSDNRAHVSPRSTDAAAAHSWPLNRTLWVAIRAFVPLTLAANIAVEATPHARGIAFVPQLRYALLTPACALAALAAAFAYRRLEARRVASKKVWFGLLTTAGGAVLGSMALVGPPGMAKAGALSVVAMTVVLAIAIPRFGMRAAGRVATVANLFFGLLAVLGVIGALASERVGPRSADGLAFEIPRATFDVDHHFVDLADGSRVHYVDEGKGPTLLFLHGNPAWSFQWHELIAGLRGSHRCVALDYPGFGLSTAPPEFGYTPREESRVVEAFVDALGLRDVTLVMQDWGGPIGLGVAGRRPELVHAVVLGNTWAWPTTTSEARGKFSKIAGGPLGELVQMNFDGFASFALKKGTVKPLADDVADMYLRPFRPIERRGVAAFYPGQITDANDYMAEVEAGLGRLRDRHALIFWGLRDPGFPRSDLEHFEKVFPDHETIALEDADHFFFEDVGPRMIERIEALFPSTAEATSAADEAASRP